MTLIEVLVALVMLAIGLTALFASEVSAVKVSQRAWKLNVATLLARCKMGEVEEEMLREGFPEIEAKGSDKCCEDTPFEGFRCTWRVERIIIPDLSQAMIEEDRDQQDAFGGLLGNSPGAGGLGGLGLGGGLGAAAGDEGKGASGDDEDEDDNSILANTAMGGSLGGDMIGSMAMSYAFPIFKPIIEQRVRRATVKVLWEEGSATQDFEATQFMVSPVPIGGVGLGAGSDTLGGAGAGGAGGAGGGVGGAAGGRGGVP